MVSAGLLRNFNNAFRLSIPKKSRKESVSELKRAIEAVRLSRKIAFVTDIFILLFSGLTGALYGSSGFYASADGEYVKSKAVEQAGG